MITSPIGENPEKVLSCFLFFSLHNFSMEVTNV
nr:MAG TPA: hypothetical protein [Caudoviricetes sp.]